MRLSSEENSFSGSHRRLVLHIAFWAFVFIVNCIYYAAGIPSFTLLITTVAFLLPVHIFYFYVVAYVLIPRLLFTKRYLQLALGVLACVLLAAFLFRCLEIFVVVPRLYAALKAINPALTWEKAEGTILHQLLSGEHFLNALEQSNTFVWIAVSVKFFKMWLDKRNAALQAELDFLKAQVHPHFLFNTLNNLYALTLERSPKAPETVLGLSDILRYMLYECNAEKVALKRDLQVLNNYIALEKIRFENRLDLNVSINGEIGNQLIAPLLLLPLVENAFKHGAGEVVEDPWITVDINLANNRLTMKVANLKPAEASKPNVMQEGMIGLSNVRKRLEILYPAHHHLRFVEEDDTFVAILKVDLI